MAYLQHDGPFGGSRSGEVLHVPAALVVEGRAPGLVLPIPLDDEVAVEEVLLRCHVSQRQEVTRLLHFLHQDVPRPLGYHTHVHVPWESGVGSQSHGEVMDGPPWLLLLHADYQTVSPLIFNGGWARVWGWVACVCVCVCIYVCIFSVGGTALSLFFIVCGWGKDESNYESVSGV